MVFNLNNYLDNFEYTPKDLINKFNFKETDNLFKYRKESKIVYKDNIKFFDTLFCGYFNFSDNKINNIKLYYSIDDMPKEFIPDNYYERLKTWDSIGIESENQKIRAKFNEDFLIKNLGHKFKNIDAYHMSLHGYVYEWDYNKYKIRAYNTWSLHDQYPEGGYILIIFK